MASGIQDYSRDDNGVKYGSKNKEFTKLQNYSPGQQKLFDQLNKILQGGAYNYEDNPMYKQLGSYIQNLLNPSKEALASEQAPYMRQFQEQTIPGLAEQFGGVGAQSSSAFQQQLGQAGAGLQEKLAALRMGQQQQGANLSFNASQLQPNANQNYYNTIQNQLNQQPFSYTQKGQQPTAFQNFNKNILPTLVRGGIAYATGGTSEIARAPQTMQEFSGGMPSWQGGN